MLQKLPSILGRGLRNARPGVDKLAFYRMATGGVPESIEVFSPGFADGGGLAKRYTADGAGISPPLQWRELPPDCASVALLVEDADSPTPQPLVHAIAWNLPGRDGGLDEGQLQDGGFDLGRNSLLRTGWLPPDPPPGHGPHHYAFQVFALDRRLDFETTPGRSRFLAALSGHVLARGCLIGIYARP